MSSVSDVTKKEAKKSPVLWWVVGGFLFLVMCSIVADPPKEDKTAVAREKVKEQPVVT